MDEALRRTADRAGIEPCYWDIHGVAHETTDETRRTVLAALGIQPDGSGLPQDGVLPPVWVLYDRSNTDIFLKLPDRNASLHWTILLEDGGVRFAGVKAYDLPETGRDGGYVWRRLSLPKLPQGYHDLTLEGVDGVAPCRLIVSPGVGYVPPASQVRRLTGISLQLYGLRSPGDWGIGDFGHLHRLVQTVSGIGVDAIGLNPLHALFPDAPAECSPYSPASRLFKNPYYIDVTAVPEFASCACAQELAMGFDAALHKAGAGDSVDYVTMARAKRAVLERMFAEFCDGEKGLRYEKFRHYTETQGQELTDFAAFLCLSEHFGTHDWVAWQQDFQDPRSVRVGTLCREKASRIAYFEYLQWLCEEQYAAAAGAAQARGMAIGLYNDMAVSVNKASADCWSHQNLFAHGLSIGSPPDPFNMAGQEWGVVPMNPSRLRASGYAHFIALLRANMRNAGALRIDHVMGLLRLFLIPAGGKPADGAYVRYPANDLYAIATLESQRNRCMLIGEDLGTVPDGYRERMAANAMLSCKVLYFERRGDGFVPPKEYPALAVASVSTHDLPTLKGYLTGSDIDTRARIGDFATPDEEAATREGRSREKIALLWALRLDGLLPDGINPDDANTGWSEALASAIQKYVARSPARLMLAQMDDLNGVARQTNLPGTTWQHPNWSTRQPVTIEDFSASPGFATLQDIVTERAR